MEPMGMWFVPLGMVLDAHGLHSIRAYAFATSAVAAFISPLIFGAMADRRGSPVVVLRWLAVATAVAMALASTAIHLGWNRWIVLATIQIHALCSSPGWSLSTTIVLSRLQNSKRQFGPVRAVATLGWMAGCWVVSWLNADASVISGFAGAIAWLLVSAFTYMLPTMPPPKSTGHISLKERLGLDALTLLKNHDHRVVFSPRSIPTRPRTCGIWDCSIRVPGCRWDRSPRSSPCWVWLTCWRHSG
jgi:MFS family permease